MQTTAHTYTAAFTITPAKLRRVSKRALPFAWAAVNTQGTLRQVAVGLASTQQLAERSARAHFSKFHGKTETEVVPSIAQA